MAFGRVVGKYVVLSDDGLWLECLGSSVVVDG